MADGIEIRIDDTRAQRKLSRLSVEIRNELKAEVPALISYLAALVNEKLDTELASRNSLTVVQEIRETSDEIYGTARLESSSNPDLPLWLEEGTASHWVEPVRAQALHWTEGGVDFFSKGHEVKGIGPYKFMQRSADEVQPMIAERLRVAAVQGAQRA